jgi:CobQ/CobB/MinD/ParA nucleotide binding domain
MTKNANGSNATIIHMSLQGKGGVRKSLVAAILSQYLASRGQEVHGIDADPVNHTLSEYRGLGARCHFLACLRASLPALPQATSFGDFAWGGSAVSVVPRLRKTVDTAGTQELAQSSQAFR